MNQQRIPETSNRGRSAPRLTAMWHRALAVVAVLALLASSFAIWDARHPVTAAAIPPTPTFAVSPTSGAAGSAVSLSATNIQRIYDTGTLSLTFDKVPIPPHPASLHVRAAPSSALAPTAAPTRPTPTSFRRARFPESTPSSSPLRLPTPRRPWTSRPRSPYPTLLP